MPFTFSHPVAILPFLGKRWKRLSATALVAGSIVPDFESFIGLGADKEYSHSWKGVFWFDLPLALLLCLIFHVLVKQPLIDNLPSRLAGKFEALRNFDWVGYANAHIWWVLGSVIMGILSHLFFDAFTHLNLRYPDAIESRIMFMGHRLYIILQYVSSVIGLLVIGAYVYKMPGTAIPVRSRDKYKFWMYLVAVTAVIATFVFTTLAREAWLADKVYLINVVIGSITYATIIVSFVYKHILRLLPR